MAPYIVSLTVDYAATGPGHLDRAACRVSMAVQPATEREPALALDVVVAVEPLHDPMSAYTALTREAIAGGEPRAAAVARVRGLLATLAAAYPSDERVLVGHGLARAASQLGLEDVLRAERTSAVDVVELTRTWNRRFEHWNFYALPRLCHVLLGASAAPANSAERAIALAAVYARLAAAPGAVSAARARLQRLQYARGFPPAVVQKPVPPAGVCVWAYDEDACTCGQASLRAPHAPGAAPAAAPAP
jgi:hypothetical protein